MQTIKRLPKSVHSSLRSGVILSDLPRVIEELIYNSIDANASKIDIAVNIRACYVKVEDDGCGITRDELVLLGEKYTTSKFHVMVDEELSFRSFGLNGEALASLSDISVVEVRTKARGRPNSYCKIIKGSKCLHLGIDDKREVVGTTVVVRELFYNQPVRRKQMQSSEKRELHHVKKCVLQIALIHPQISLRLLDNDSEDELLYTEISSSPLPLISKTFGDDISRCLHEITASDQVWTLSGHISGPADVFCTKDWRTVLLFFEQSVTNYWKKHQLQSPKVKLNKGLLKDHNVQNEKEYAHFESTQQTNAVKDTNSDMSSTRATRNSHCFSFVMEPSIQNVCFSGRITNSCRPDDNVASIDYKLGYKQMHYPENGSYKWLDDGPSHLNDDISSVNPTCWKRQRTEGIFHEYAYSGNLVMLEDVPTEGYFAHEQETELIGPEVEIPESCFRALNKPNGMTPDFVQNKTNLKAQTSGWDGLYDKFEKLNGDCLLDNGFYHDGGSTSKGTCRVLRKSSTSKKLGTAAGCVEGLEADAINQMNFPDIHALWNSDLIDRSSFKDTLNHFSHPSLLADTPCSHPRTLHTLNRTSDKCFRSWNYENIDSNVRFSNDSSIIFEGTKNFDNFNNEIQSLNYFNDKCGSTDQLGFEEDLTTWKSKFDMRLSVNISPETAGDNGCHLNVPSLNIANDNLFTQDLLNQHNSGLNQRLRTSKCSRFRSHSAPPFYRGKLKFSRLNVPLSKPSTDSDKDICVNNPEDNAPGPVDIPCISSTQPIPETDSSEFPDLNFSSVKMSEVACSDEIEDSTAQITKWQDDPVQHTALNLPHGPFGCYDDILSISSGALHLSCSSLIPECVDKNCFEEARVLLQLDKKFIPVISGETILLVDQHAADERIRLEELRSKVLSEGHGVSYLDSEEELSLPETGFQLFQKYAEQIQKWGWIISGGSNSSESFKKNMNILKRQVRLVTLVAVPCIFGVKLTGKDLMEFIWQLDETDGSSDMPPAVLRILNFKACRGAIMFGDPLLPSECCLIIEELKATSLCFQCAHGRPTTVPILNIASLHDELARLQMLSGRKAETWHGLGHHEPSLERAHMRLERLRKLRRGL
ncbi:DNA mismatch repair protein MLH3 isoform X3 [Zea mays]|uniref:DNA mismatch repair protein MLH3 isoform X3 n=1 Tax=Zea mays TaxID=4577 RepID=UPI000C6C3EC3|nr:DNA mismatch repair protein MLH3 isoform X3 [Zea mays]|eukprot:XP_023157456.1 DNA mismatch repair protein MLH3 isoform X3 [Zea mays]